MRRKAGAFNFVEEAKKVQSRFSASLRKQRAATDAVATSNASLATRMQALPAHDVTTIEEADESADVTGERKQTTEQERVVISKSDELLYVSNFRHHDTINSYNVDLGLGSADNSAIIEAFADRN